MAYGIENLWLSMLPLDIQFVLKEGFSTYT